MAEQKSNKAIGATNGAATLAKAQHASRDACVPVGVSRNHWVVTLTKDQVWEDAMKPEFWKLVAHQFNVGDIIELRDNALENWGELIIKASNPPQGYAEVFELRRVMVSPDSGEGREKMGHTYKYEGLTDKWCIYRKTDGMRMERNIAHEREAIHRIMTHWQHQAA